MKPSVYVAEIRAEIDVADVFASHLVDVSALEGDDYKVFLMSRLEQLVARIESVTGRSVVALTDSEPGESGDAEVDEEADT